MHGYMQVLSVHASPVAADYDETLHVIKYAALATSISLAESAPQPQLQPIPLGTTMGKADETAGWVLYQTELPEQPEWTGCKATHSLYHQACRCLAHTRAWLTSCTHHQTTGIEHGRI